MERKKTIEQHIDENLKEIDDPSINRQRFRHLMDETDKLKKYKENHPEDHYDPSPLELFCDENPSALECKIFEN